MPDTLPYDEKELLQKLAEGDPKAYRRLVDSINSKITTFVRTHIGIKEPQLIEEAVCDVLLQLWLSREILPGLDSFDKYLYILARNKGLNVLKKELRERNRRMIWVKANDDIDETERALKESDALNLIEQAIAQLPPQQQKVWILSRKKSLTYEQISQQMNISRETVKSYLQAANQAIKSFVLSRMKDIHQLVFILIFFSE